MRMGSRNRMMEIDREAVDPIGCSVPACYDTPDCIVDPIGYV